MLADPSCRIADGEVLVNGNRLELPMAPDRLPSDTHAQARAITTDEARSAVPAVASDGSTQPLYQTNSAEGNRGHSSGSTTRGRPTSGRDRRQPVNQNQGQNPGEGRPLPPYPRSYTSSSLNRREGPPNGGPVRSGGGPGMLVASPTGGVQMTLDGHGSWSDLARQDATLPADASGANNETGGNGRASEGSGGVFGFLRGRRGRAGSPKPKERGVLGKEGARQVIG
jgi:serine/threonine kinase 32